MASRPAFLLRDAEAQTLRVGFADVIAEGVAFGDIENDPEAFRALVTRVHAAVKALSSYVGAVLRLYQADRDLHIIDP